MGVNFQSESGAKPEVAASEFDAVINERTTLEAVREILKSMPEEEARKLMAACGFFSEPGSGAIEAMEIMEISSLFREDLRRLYNPSLDRAELIIN